MAGEAGSADRLIETFKLKMSRGLDGVTKVAEAFAEFCKKEAKKSAGVPMHPDYFPDFSFIIAGLDPKKGKYVVPRSYNLDSTTGYRLFLSRMFEVHGKWLIALYMFSKQFEVNMVVDQLCRLTAQALYDTAKIDGEVGGDLKMAKIESDGYHPISDRDIQSFIEPWELRRLKAIMKQ